MVVKGPAVNPLAFLSLLVWVFRHPVLAAKQLIVAVVAVPIGCATFAVSVMAFGSLASIVGFESEAGGAWPMIAVFVCLVPVFFVLRAIWRRLPPSWRVSAEGRDGFVKTEPALKRHLGASRRQPADPRTLAVRVAELDARMVAPSEISEPEAPDEAGPRPT